MVISAQKAAFYKSLLRATSQNTITTIDSKNDVYWPTLNKKRKHQPAFNVWHITDKISINITLRKFNQRFL